MMKRSLILLAFFPIWLAPNVFALTCGNRLIEIGHRQMEVIEKCGEPTLIERSQEEVITYRSNGWERQIRSIRRSSIEEWTYNFGSKRFMYFLKFVDGKLVAMETGTLGSDRPIALAPKSDCGRRVDMGDRRIDVLLKCGKATTIERKEEVRGGSSFATPWEGISVGRLRQVDIEEWTYNFGPSYFLLFIQLENGRVTRMEHGDYGF